jgi:UTP--glucose-1-phosphate uridylyltransferase
MKPETEELIRTRMRTRGIDDEAIREFLRNVRKASSRPAYVPLSQTETPGPDLLVDVTGDMESLNQLETLGTKLLKELVVIKLNGGRSTTMGGSVPKGILEAKDGLSYLEIVVSQLQEMNRELGLNIPLMLMNSFFTHEPTMAIVNRLQANVLPLVQGQVPRLLQESLAPLETGTEEDWVPPGHGDLYSALKRSRLLESLLEKGFRWAFVSNIDNLAACPEPWILGLIKHHDLDFLMEVTDRTNADRKGGTPVWYDGRLDLLEIAQVSPDERVAFQDVHRFPFFNTNNIWVNLEVLQTALSNGPLDLPVIQNRKHVAGEAVLQLETAMGAALGCFHGSKALKVGRERFFPTKKVSDLFILRSDACVLDPMFRLRRNPSRPDSLPFMPRVFFSEDFLDSPLAMGARFKNPSSVSLLRTDILEVRGAVYFEEDITVRGRVEIWGDEQDHYRIPKGTILREGRYPPLVRQDEHGLALPEPEVYPLELSRMAVEKVWGSSAIGWALPREMANLPPIGELWETFDGHDEGSVILNGTHRLKPLRELVQELGASLIGERLTKDVDRPFPLLIKYLFPSQALSVQVHPNDEYAMMHEQSLGKTEMWLVLSAAHGSYIIVGWQPGMGKEELKEKLLRQEFESCMQFIRPSAGDVYFIPAGTVHALGPGVAVLEIQQNSDVTYRLYDWNRMADDGALRPLHIEKALDVLNFDYVSDYRIAPLTVRQDAAECSYLCANRYFAACRWHIREKTNMVSNASCFWVLNVIGGQGSLSWAQEDPIWLEQGATLLIPAALGEFTIEPSSAITFIQSWVPDLNQDILLPLRKAGFADSDIIALGGMGPGNDLRK